MQYHLLILALLASPVLAQDTTTTGDGSVSGDLSTNVTGGSINDSYNPSENITNNYNGAGSSPLSQPVPTASAPMMSGGGGNDSCLIPSSEGFQISLFGRSSGSMTQDPECNRRKDARLMGAPQASGGLGLQVAGISVMCQNANVFKAMAMSSTPCPIVDVVSAKILTGRDAYVRMRQDPSVYIPNYVQDKVFWDTLLLMNLEELPDAPPEPERPSLSDRFRTSGGASARPNNDEPR